MADQFRIGKGGPTILQGSSSPDNSLGNNGDLYVQIGTSPRLYIKQITGWYVSSDPVNGYIREAVTNSGTTQINFDTTYVGVNVSNAATIQLNTGIAGKTVTVKDEGGTAGSNTITVIGQSGDAIDGQSYWSIDINYGFLTLVYNGAEWSITSSCTSAPFDTMKL